MKTLRVRYFLRLQKVDLPLQGITLVVGRNSNGKSSLLDAAVCAFTQTHEARGVKTKRGSSVLVHDGRDAGSISLEDDVTGGALRIAYPGGEITTEGAPWEAEAPLAIGGERFMDLSDAKRAAALAAHFTLDPVKDDFLAWFKDRPEAGITPERAEALWKRLERDGWDASHTAAKEHGLKIKGKWEQATGERYGAVKAEAYMPDGLMVGENYDMDAAAADHEKAKAELEVLVRAAGMSAGRRAEMKAVADRGPIAARECAALEAEYASMSDQMDEKLEAQRTLPTIGGTEGTPLCPHCNKPVRFSPTKGQSGAIYTFLEKAPPPPSAEDTEKVKADIHRLAGEISKLREAMASNERERTKLRGEVAQGMAAATALTRAESLPETDEDAVNQARANALRMERRLTAITKLTHATAFRKQMKAHEWIIKAYAPEGMRKDAMDKKMVEINTRLAELSRLAGFEDVQLDEELTGTLGGRSYLLNGESGRWRVDLILTALFNIQDQAEIILVDRLDVLEPQARPGVMRMLKGIGCPALVMMMAKDASSAPDLAKIDFGRTVWIDDGNLSL